MVKSLPVNQNAPYVVTLVRHGESVGNAEGRYQGHADFPLTERGIAQARALASQWQAEGRQFDGCISSPLLRARQTAEILCALLNVPLELDPCWMELDIGLISGLSEAEAEQVVPKPAFATPYTRAGATGESRWELYLRAGKGIQALLDRPPGRYLIVAHGGILNMALYAMLGIAPQADIQGPRFQFENTAYATLTYEPNRHTWRLIAFCQPAEIRQGGEQ